MKKYHDHYELDTLITVFKYMGMKVLKWAGIGFIVLAIAFVILIILIKR